MATAITTKKFTEDSCTQRLSYPIHYIFPFHNIKLSSELAPVLEISKSMNQMYKPNSTKPALNQVKVQLFCYAISWPVMFCYECLCVIDNDLLFIFFLKDDSQHQCSKLYTVQDLNMYSCTNNSYEFVRKIYNQPFPFL